jgi:hypothetical protein
VSRAISRGATGPCPPNAALSSRCRMNRAETRPATWRRPGPVRRRPRPRS